jgi:thioredoxin-like negative regulator of GroEL
MKPTIDQFNATQINIFEHPEAVKQYDLKVTPTTIIFKDGKQVARLENVHSAEEISKILNS